MKIFHEVFNYIFYLKILIKRIEYIVFLYKWTKSHGFWTSRKVRDKLRTKRFRWRDTVLAVLAVSSRETPSCHRPTIQAHRQMNRVLRKLLVNSNIQMNWNGTIIVVTLKRTRNCKRPEKHTINRQDVNFTSNNLTTKIVGIELLYLLLLLIPILTRVPDIHGRGRMGVIRQVIPSSVYYSRQKVGLLLTN